MSCFEPHEASPSLQGGPPQHALRGGSGWRGEPSGAGRELLPGAAGPSGVRQHEQRRAARVGVSTGMLVSVSVSIKREAAVRADQDLLH